MFTELRPAHAYGRMPPSLFNLQGPDAGLVRDLYRILAEERVACPAEGYEVHEHCYLYDGCYVLDPGLEWVAESVADYGIAETIKPVLQDVIRGRHHQPLPGSARKTVMIAKAGADNYGHTLSDILPKLVNVGRAGLGPVRLLLPTGMRHFEPVVLAVLSYLGVDAETLFHAPATLVEARGVYRFTAVSRHNTRKSATFLELADILRAMYGIRPERRRRLYVRRSDGDHRRIEDAAAVEAAFARHGFEGVYPADLPFEAQVALFASASHVAGAMGAGLSNIGWAPPGCEVFVIDPGVGDTYFWDFACLLRQPYSWMFARPLCGYNAESTVANFAVDGQVLGAALRLAYG